MRVRMMYLTVDTENPKAEELYCAVITVPSRRSSSSEGDDGVGCTRIDADDSETELRFAELPDDVQDVVLGAFKAAGFTNEEADRELPVGWTASVGDADGDAA